MDNKKRYNPDLECEQIIARLNQLCDVRGLSKYALSKSAELSKSAVHELMSGKTRPYVHTLYKLCNALDISIEELLFDREYKRDAGLSGDEKALLAFYQSLTKKKRELLHIFLEMLYQYQETEDSCLNK